MDIEMLIGSRFELGTETEEQVLNPRSGALMAKLAPDALLLPADIGFVVAQWAIWRAGGVCVPLLPDDNLRYLVVTGQFDSS